MAEHPEQGGASSALETGAPATPAKSAKPLRPRLLRVGVSLALLGLLLLLVDLEAVWRVAAKARPDLLALMCACLVAERLFAAWRWLVLLRTVEPGVAYWPVLRVTLVSNFVGAFLPGGIGTEVLRVYNLSRVMADLPLALSSVLVERLCGLISLILLSALGLIFAPIHLPNAIQVMLGLGLLALLGMAAALLHPWPRRLLERAPATPGLARLTERLIGLEQRIDAYAGQRFALALSLGLAVGFQFLRIATIMVGAQAFGINAAPLVFIAIVPITILVALLPISLGGLGAREVAYVALLGLAGVEPEAALVLALTREVLYLATALPGAVLYACGPTIARANATP